MSGAVIRNGLWLGFFALILWAWWFLYQMAMDMDLDLIGRPGAIGAAMREHGHGHLHMAGYGPLFTMWIVMMAAMMLPTMVPTLRTYSDLIDSANGSVGGWCGVLLGYCVVWIALSGAFVAAQIVLLRTGLVDYLGIATSPYFAGAVLIMVGAYQFSSLKEACQNVCLSPMSYFLTHWRTGFAGGLRMGLGLGVFCVGCCWALMVLGFVGGVMNLLWMGLATALMVMEKLQPIGRWITRPVGAVLILAGVVMMSAPIWQGGL